MTGTPTQHGWQSFWRAGGRWRAEGAAVLYVAVVLLLVPVVLRLAATNWPANSGTRPGTTGVPA